MNLQQYQEDTLKKFDEKFPHKIAEVIDDFGSTTKTDIKSFLSQALLQVREDTLRKVGEIIKTWKNEGENPTETDLVLENILSSIKLLDNKEDNE